MLRALITAVRTLTVLPIPGADADRMASALPWFPLVGSLLGGILYAIAIIIGSIDNNSWPQGSALVVIGFGILLTNGLHLDGLADWADAFGNRHDRKKTLEIMKDSCTGVFGVVSIVIVVLAKWVSLARIIGTGFPNYIVSAYIVSRTMQAEMAASFPYAREEDGTAAPFVRDARFCHRCAAMILGLLLLALVNGIAGLMIFAVGWIACRLFGFWSYKRIGGVTGDVLGACSELIETIILFLCAMLEKKIMGFHL